MSYDYLFYLENTPLQVGECLWSAQFAVAMLSLCSLKNGMYVNVLQPLHIPKYMPPAKYHAFCCLATCISNRNENMLHHTSVKKDKIQSIQAYLNVLAFLACNLTNNYRQTECNISKGTSHYLHTMRVKVKWCQWVRMCACVLNWAFSWN